MRQHPRWAGQFSAARRVREKKMACFEAARGDRAAGHHHITKISIWKINLFNFDLVDAAAMDIGVIIQMLLPFSQRCISLLSLSSVDQ